MKKTFNDFCKEVYDELYASPLIYGHSTVDDVVERTAVFTNEAANRYAAQAVEADRASLSKELADLANSEAAHVYGLLQLSSDLIHRPIEL